MTADAGRAAPASCGPSASTTSSASAGSSPDAPRSATVTAATDGLLFMMDGDAFLELVGARQAVADRLLALYDTPVAEIAARS